MLHISYYIYDIHFLFYGMSLIDRVPFLNRPEKNIIKCHLRRRKKNTLFYGRTDSKKRSVGRAYFFLIIFFLHFLPKLPEKNCDFFLLASLQIFIQIFVQKIADFTTFGSKKKKRNEHTEKKRSVGPVKQCFLFSWPYH